MPLPLETRNNPHICKYIVMPLNELDEQWATEQWERVPTDKDTPGDKLRGIKPVFYGAWKDTTELLKAQQELLKAEMQLALMQKRRNKGV